MRRRRNQKLRAARADKEKPSKKMRTHSKTKKKMKKATKTTATVQTNQHELYYNKLARNLKTYNTIITNTQNAPTSK